MTRKNIISERVIVTSSSRDMAFDMVVPFGNSGKPRLITDITVSMALMSGLSYQGIECSIRCNDFNINRTTLVSVSSAEPISISSMDTISPNSQFSPVFNTQNLGFMDIAQPWVAADLHISVAFRINIVPVESPFVTFINIYYEEEY